MMSRFKDKDYKSSSIQHKSKIYSELCENYGKEKVFHLAGS